MLKNFNIVSLLLYFLAKPFWSGCFYTVWNAIHAQINHFSSKSFLRISLKKIITTTTMNILRKNINYNNSKWIEFMPTVKIKEITKLSQK